MRIRERRRGFEPFQKNMEIVKNDETKGCKDLRSKIIFSKRKFHSKLKSAIKLFKGRITQAKQCIAKNVHQIFSGQLLQKAYHTRNFCIKWRELLRF